jgi:hypothetical protein
MFEIEYGWHGMKTRLKSKTRLLRPEKVCRAFDGILMGSLVLPFFFRELHSIHHGSAMEIWSGCLKNSFRLGGVQGEENW